MTLHRSTLPPEILERIRTGTAIPAHPLALDRDRRQGGEVDGVLGSRGEGRGRGEEAEGAGDEHGDGAQGTFCAPPPPL